MPRPFFGARQSIKRKTMGGPPDTDLKKKARDNAKRTVQVMLDDIRDHYGDYDLPVRPSAVVATITRALASLMPKHGQQMDRPHDRGPQKMKAHEDASGVLGGILSEMVEGAGLVEGRFSGDDGSMDRLEDAVLDIKVYTGQIVKWWNTYKTREGRPSSALVKHMEKAARSLEYVEGGVRGIRRLSESKESEDRAWELGRQYGKKHRLGTIRSTEQMYQSAKKLGVAGNFDIFKYGAQDVWRSTGQMR